MSEALGNLHLFTQNMLQVVWAWMIPLASIRKYFLRVSQKD